LKLEGELEMEIGVGLLSLGDCVIASAIVGDTGAMVICGVALLPTKLAGDCSTTMSWSQVMFVCKEGRDDMIDDGLLSRLDREGGMALSVGDKFMSVAWSMYEFEVRDMVGEEGGVLKISKSSSGVDMSQVACSQ
jgi:hypothetical protein